MNTSEPEGLYTASRSPHSSDQGGFRTRFNFPGRNHPTHEDHGYGPLATVVESFMDPGTLISMHPHRNEEIISWVPAGVMRHDDRAGNQLVTDADHLMVMGAGEEFWHEERTLDEDPPLRMLQMFVRPHSLDLPPTIQHEPIPDPVDGAWRHLFGPTGSDALLSVRNEVHLYDVHLPEGVTVDLPAIPEWATYLYVFEGTVDVDGAPVGETESALLTEHVDRAVTASEQSLVVAFLVDPDAPVTRQGTIGR